MRMRIDPRTQEYFDHRPASKGTPLVILRLCASEKPGTPESSGLAVPAETMQAAKVPNDIDPGRRTNETCCKDDLGTDLFDITRRQSPDRAIRANRHDAGVSIVPRSKSVDHDGAGIGV